MHAYIAAKELAEVIVRAKIVNSIRRDPAERAVCSVFLQLAEGLPNDSRPMRRKYFTCARNRLFELVAATDLARSLGALDDGTWSEAQALASRVRAMLVALLRATLAGSHEAREHRKDVVCDARDLEVRGLGGRAGDRGNLDGGVGLDALAARDGERAGSRCRRRRRV